MKFFIDTYGCAKNQVDSEYLLTLLQERDAFYTSDIDEADVILVNSCGFIDSAKKESVGALKFYKEKYPSKKVILCGCLSQVASYDKAVKKSIPKNIDIVGNENLATAANKIIQSIKGAGFCAGDLSEVQQYPNRDILFGGSGTCYVKVAEGCSNHCAFCAIPLIRGELRSRDIESVYSEIQGLLKSGVFEVNLIAQDLGSYGVDAVGTCQLGALLKMISKLTGDFWVRMLYIHPDNFPKEIIDICKNDSRILPYFDIPFQSGSDNIIRAMGRHGSREKYIALIRTIKDKLPNAAIRTTIMTGFPGETDADFNDTVNFLKEISPLWSGSFIFNAQRGTRAFNMVPTIPSGLSKERVAKLQTVQEAITSALLEGYVGKTLDVFIEEELDDSYIGRTWFCAPDVDGSVILHSAGGGKGLKVGSVQKAAITSVAGCDLVGVCL